MSRIINRIIDNALDKALARRYTISHNPTMVYTTRPMTAFDRTIAIRILNDELRRLYVI